jgi:AcrR family transcriptional regulator
VTAPARRRAAPRHLTVPEIVVAARALIERGGVDECSMRALSAQLGVQPPALYRHIEDKDHLLALVLDDVMGDVPPAPPGPWRVQLATAMHNLRRRFLDSPNLLDLHLRSHAHGPRSLRFLADTCAPLRRAGFSDEACASAISTLTSYTLGLTLLQTRLAWRWTPEQLRASIALHPHTELEGMALDDLHATYRILEATVTVDADAVFADGLSRIIAGLDPRS